MKQLYLTWLFAVALIAASAASVQSLLEEGRLRAEANSRSLALADSIEDSVLTHYHAKRFHRIAKLVDRLRKGEGSSQTLMGLGICALKSDLELSAELSRVYPSSTKPDLSRICAASQVVLAAARPAAPSTTESDSDRHWHREKGGVSIEFLAHRLEEGTEGGGTLVLVIAQNVSYLKNVWSGSFLRTLGVTFLGGLALLILFAAQTRSWVQGNFRLLRQSLRSILAGRKPGLTPMLTDPEVSAEIKPLSQDLDKLAAKILSLTPRGNPGIPSIRKFLGERNLVVIANREPYIHQRKGDRIEIVRPASGLVTALEPILRQSGGMWVAHGSGSADWETSDKNGEVAVPPNKPTYKLKRVRLTPEEEEGYYYGFSNEGLWPLCHLAHTRPTFRLSDWRQYSAVNQKFADSIPASAVNEESLFLVQDYHFALLPRMLQERAAPSKPKIGLFWHIPWPNPEAFGICPWNQDLLRGMLGSDVIGFHTQYHCNNFLETCNRYLEARIDWEHFTVTMENHVTRVLPFPIGIDTSSPVRVLPTQEIKALKEKYGIQAEFVAVGVDRIDYTKGLVERVEAVERFLEKNPEFIGRFSLVQMGSPSRTTIPAYRALNLCLEEVVKRVNERFGNRDHFDVPEGYQPVMFLGTHHEWDDIQYFYQMGDVCMVTSLHDGMNLVAKEYVWCQQPERGSLILSKFTGASRELTEAFVVNPYSTEEMADALKAALALSPAEKAHRMSAMREKIRTHNAHQWAANLVEALVKKDDNSIPHSKPQDPPDRLRLALPSATSASRGASASVKA